MAEGNNFVVVKSTLPWSFQCSKKKEKGGKGLHYELWQRYLGHF